jgi:hypothetical protein
MNTTKSYNPFYSAIRELMTTDAQRWYVQQLRAGATLAQTLTLKTIMKTQKLLNARTHATAAFAEPKQAAVEATAPVEAPANDRVLEAIASTDLILAEVVELKQDVSRSPRSRAEVDDRSAVDDYELLLDESEATSDDDLESVPPLVEDPPVEDPSFYLPDEDVEADSSQDETPLDVIAPLSDADATRDEGTAFAWEKTPAE